MPTKTIIKVCGLTRLDEALACSELGVQWLGFNCFRGSKRYLPPEAIATIIQQLPSEVKTVGVFCKLFVNRNRRDPSTDRYASGSITRR